MIEEIENLKSDVRGIKVLLEVTVPRWAADEPVRGEPIQAAPIPSLSEEGLQVQAAHWYTGYSPSSTAKSDVALDLDLPITEVQLSESIYDLEGYLVETRKFENNTVAQHEQYTYDPSHNLISRAFEDTTDELTEKEVRHYDFQGRLTSKSVTGTDDITLSTSYQRSVSGVEETLSGPDGIESRVHKVIDNSGRVIESKELDSDGNLVSGEARSYNETGKLTEIWTLEEDGSRWLRELFEFDSEDREIRWSETLEDGSTNQQRETTYDNGRPTCDVLYELDNETKTTYEYDSQGRLQRTFSVSEISEIETVHAYEEHGLPAMTATRMVKDKRSTPIRGIYPGASTTWWVYEFYQS